MINRRLNTKLASVSEGITEAGTPDMKYYAFDWDDNIMKMPTKIILKTKDGEEVGMSTEDFAHYRSKIGSEEFKYEDNIIVGYGERPFRNFNVEGDKKFVIDAMTAEIGPAWSDFVEAINLIMTSSASNAIFNIGTTEEVSIHELALRILH
jgi:hypothetical protein